MEKLGNFDMQANSTLKPIDFETILREENRTMLINNVFFLYSCNTCFPFFKQAHFGQVVGSSVPKTRLPNMPKTC
jgi:hypothetical protein